MRNDRGLTHTQTAVLTGVTGLLALILLVRNCDSNAPERTINLACPTCGKVFRDQAMSQASKTCPACGKAKLVRAVQCYLCDHIFAEPPLVENPDSPVEPLPAACPKCGSTDIGEPEDTNPAK
jgi:hypothetical protein